MSKPTKHFLTWFEAATDTEVLVYPDELKSLCWRAYLRGRQYGFRDGVRRMRGHVDPAKDDNDVHRISRELDEIARRLFERIEALTKGEK